MPEKIDLSIRKKERDLAHRGTATRLKDARRAHRLGGPRAGIRAYCAGNKWLIENAKSVGNL